eukprot:6019647-Pyramimonas_sp.AAC.1
MASTLVRQWSQSFQQEGVDRTVDLAAWTEGLPQLAELPLEWNITVEDVRKAVWSSGSSAPGPD